MIRLYEYVEAEPWELSESDLKKLDWDSLNAKHFDTMPEEFIWRLPEKYFLKLSTFRAFSSLSTRFLLDLVGVYLSGQSKTQYMQPYRRDYALSEMFMNWFPAEFLRENAVKIQRRMQSNYHFNSTKIALVNAGAIPLSTVNIDMDYLEHSVINSRHIPLAERKNFFENTNYMYEYVMDCYYYELPVVLPCKDLEDIGLPAPRRNIDREYMSEFTSFCGDFLPNKETISWDELVVEYYKDNVPYRVLEHFWYESFSTFAIDNEKVPPKESFYKPNKPRKYSLTEEKK